MSNNHMVAATANASKSLRRRPRLRRAFQILFGLTLSIVTLILLALGAGGPGEKKLSFGSTKISWELDSDTSQHKFYVYESHDQNRDGGGFYNEKELSLRTPFGTLEITAVYDPIDTIRARLPKSIPELTALLDSRNRFEVFCAAEALGEMKAEASSVLPNLIAAAEQHSSVYHAIETIANADPKSSVPPLIHGLSATKPELQSYCAHLLAGFGTNSLAAAPLLLSAFHRNAPNRIDFAWTYHSITGDLKPILPHGLTILNNNTNHYELMAMLGILRRAGRQSAPAIPAIIQILRTNQYPAAQSLALRTLAAASADTNIVFPEVLNVLHSMEPVRRPLRQAAISLLPEFGADGVIHLLPLYRSTNQLDKGPAGQALAKAGPLAVIATNEIQTELLSKDLDRIQLACLIAANLGTNAAPLLPTLNQLLYVPKPHIRAGAATTLLRLAHYDDTMIRVLVDFFGHVPYGIPRRPLETLLATIQTNSTAKAIYDERLAINRKAAANIQRILDEARLFGLNLRTTNHTPSHPNH